MAIRRAGHGTCRRLAGILHPEAAALPVRERPARRYGVCPGNKLFRKRSTGALSDSSPVFTE
ncbi:hypothetical protein GCM10009097_12530 [Pigmentiphaga daeguensis]|uniref:Uncharacterized protein n=1 Tax=Pigmentiphaga daeguensis TaxID=414049 RepID=A0ABP3LFL8_9BURK